MANASVSYDETKLDIPKIEEFVKKAGFKSLGEFKEINSNTKSKKENKTLVTTHMKYPHKQGWSNSNISVHRNFDRKSICRVLFIGKRKSQ